MVATILRAGGASFNVNFEHLRNYLRDPIVRRVAASVLSGIGRHGVTKPQFLDAPFLVVWNFTNACNLRCKHCYQRADKPAPNELSTEERLKIVGELAEKGVVSIAFSGGEPLMRRDFYEVAMEAKRRGMYIALATNGETDESGYSIARKLRMHPPSVYRSLKSAKENITKLRRFLKELEELEKKQANGNEPYAH